LVALLFVQLCFALFPIFVKWTYDGGSFTAAAVATWRICIGALAFTIPAGLLYGRKLVPPREDLIRIISCAMLGVVLNQGLYLQGMTHATALSAGLLMCLIPVFTYAVALVIRQERLTGRRALGVAIALMGAGPLAIHDLSAVAEAGSGNLLLVANAFCYSVYLVISKPLLVRHPPLVVIAWVYLLSLPAAPFFAGGIFAEGATLWPGDASDRARVGLVLVLIFPTVLGYFLGIFALARTRASTSAAFVYLQPLITGVCAVVLLGEVASRSLILPGVLLLVGLWLVTRK